MEAEVHKGPLLNAVLYWTVRPMYWTVLNSDGLIYRLTRCAVLYSDGGGGVLYYWTVLYSDGLMY
eukprot:5094812-Pyramimonas_sp.AAC.1